MAWVWLARFGARTNADLRACDMPRNGLGRPSLEGVLSVVQEGRRDWSGSVLPWASLVRLRELIAVQALTVVTVDSRRSVPLNVQELSDEGRVEECFGPAGPTDDDGLFAQHFPTFAIPVYQRRTGDVTTPLRWSDFYSDRELANQPLWTECFRPDGHHHGMILTLPAQFPAERRLLMWRGKGPGFSDDDVAILSLLRPHLYELMREAEERATSGLDISPRETQVLRLVGRGLTNPQIAEILVISVATVRKHLENVYRRTGTHNRLAAAELVRTAQPVMGLAARRSWRSPPPSTSAPP